MGFAAGEEDFVEIEIAANHQSIEGDIPVGELQGRFEGIIEAGLGVVGEVEAGDGSIGLFHQGVKAVDRGLFASLEAVVVGDLEEGGDVRSFKSGSWEGTISVFDRAVLSVGAGGSIVAVFEDLAAWGIPDRKFLTQAFGTHH